MMDYYLVIRCGERRRELRGLLARGLGHVKRTLTSEGEHSV
jgi:hypothetical protein